jgi:hypothetical protein
MVYDGSTTGQREHWKKKKKPGHKHACREQGQIKIGDDMQMSIPTMRDTFGLVRVTYCVGDEGQWQVKRYGSNSRDIVNGANLLRLRPPSTLVIGKSVRTSQLGQ